MRCREALAVNSFTNNADGLTGPKQKNTIEILLLITFIVLPHLSACQSFVLQETREVESPTFIGTMTFLYLINSKFFGKMTIDINQ